MERDGSEDRREEEDARGLLYFNLKPKIFQDSLSHRIFRVRVLNINENKN